MDALAGSRVQSFSAPRGGVPCTDRQPAGQRQLERLATGHRVRCGHKSEQHWRGCSTLAGGPVRQVSYDTPPGYSPRHSLLLLRAAAVARVSVRCGRVSLRRSPAGGVHCNGYPSLSTIHRTRNSDVWRSERKKLLDSAPETTFSFLLRSDRTCTSCQMGSSLPEKTGKALECMSRF